MVNRLLPKASNGPRGPTYFECNIFPKVGRAFLTSLVVDSLSDFASFVTSGSNVGIMQLGPVEQQLVDEPPIPKPTRLANDLSILHEQNMLIRTQRYHHSRVQPYSKLQVSTREEPPSWNTLKLKKWLGRKIPHEFTSPFFFRGITLYHEYNDAAELGGTQSLVMAESNNWHCMPTERKHNPLQTPTGLFRGSFLRL